MLCVLLHVTLCCEFCAAVLYAVMCSCKLCRVAACYQELLHDVQCCYVTKSYYMLCSVVNVLSQELLHAVQCCYMLQCVGEICAGRLYVVMCSCVFLHVVTCCIVLLNFVQQCYVL